MKKRVMKKLIVVAAAIATVIAAAMIFESWLDNQIDKIYNVSAYTKPINLQYDDYSKDKGQLILEKSAENGNVILMGSSELNSWVGQNPVNMFPNTTLNDDLTIVGQAYVQSLLHSMKAGTPALEGAKKLGIVVSLQWFYGDDIDTNGFAVNFSEYQFYQCMKNDRLSEESKNYICSRTSELLKEVEGYDDIKVYAWLHSRDSIFANAAFTVLSPYYNLREKTLEIKDKWDTYQLLKKTSGDAREPDVLDLDWDKSMQDAKAEGAAFCTNNEYYVADEYYDTYLRDTIDTLRDAEAETTLNSKEMQDFEMFLQICRENGVRPYVIIMNTNGLYYDYVGMDGERRNGLYDEVEKRAKVQGAEVLRLSEYEYEPYFMLDVMHLGWKGWLYVDEQISKHYAEIKE